MEDFITMAKFGLLAGGMIGFAAGSIIGIVGVLLIAFVNETSGMSARWRKEIMGR